MTGPDMTDPGPLPPPELPPGTPPGPRPMIAIVRAQPGKAAEFGQLITELGREVRKEPGCISFVPDQELDAEGEFYIYEIYASPAAFEEHLQTEHVRRFLAAAPGVSDIAVGKLVQLTEIPVPEP
jgi:quinol monooxygenase YgiN